MPKLKLYGSIIATAGVIGLVAFLFWRIGELKDDRLARLQEINRLEWKLVTIEAEKDSIKGLGEYSPPDTILVTDTLTFTDTISGETRIVYRDRLVASGDIAFDETQVFGEDSSLSVQVRGRLYYPKEFKWRSWIQIIPDWRKPPIVPVTARMPRKWGVGLGLLASSNGTYNVGGIGRFNRTSVALYRRIDQNVWTLGLNYELLRF